MRASPTSLLHVPELQLPRDFVACLAKVQVLCCLTYHVLDLLHLDEICVPLQMFLST